MDKRCYNKNDIIRRSSYKINMSNEELKIIFDCFMNTIGEILKQPEERIHLEIRNFGSFDIIPTKLRGNARNPISGERIIIPPRKRLTFKPSKNIKDEIYKSRSIV